MNLFKWLASKAGKMPISFAQAVGITAVVGAAGVAAVSYLGSPADNTSFVPPAYEQSGDVVYVSRGGGGRYTPNGEIESAFNAAPSQSIILANKKYEQEQRKSALREYDAQSAYTPDPDEGGDSPQLPKAYQVGSADVGLGMGENFDKQASGALEMFSNLQKNLSGMGETIANAASTGSSPQGGAGAPGAGGDSDSGNAQFTKTTPNWGQGGGVHAGSGNGVNNSFVIQNSGKNNGGGKDVPGVLADADKTMKQAQQVLKNMQEGPRMQGSRASFGRSDGLDGDNNYAGGRARYGRDGRDELNFIHQQTKKIVRNPRNAPNAGGFPLMASAKITGGVEVDKGFVSAGGNVSPSKLKMYDNQLGAVKSKLGGVENDLEKRTKKRHELRKWMWWALPLALVLIPMIGTWADLARSSGPFGILFWGFAIAAAGLALFPIYKLIEAGISYNSMYGGDFYSKFAIALGGFLGGGVALALTVPAIGAWMGGLATWVLGAAAGIGFAGAYIFKFLSEKGDGYTDEQLDDNLTKGTLDERAEALRHKGDEVHK